MKRHIAIFLLATIIAVASCNLPLSTSDQLETGSEKIEPDVETTDAESVDSIDPEIFPPDDLPVDLVLPEDLTYLGAFRLPEGSNDSNWEYSGYAMTYYPDGDPQDQGDGYPGSLFAVGHDHQQFVSEISIPEPVISPGNNLDDLNTTETLKGFHDITGGAFGYLEIPRAGLAYLPPQGDQSSGKLHFAWGQHFEDEWPATHGWSDLDLSAPNTAGPWYIDGYSNYVTNDYMFEIPEDWASNYTPGLRLATGRFRDGHWSGLGPALFAIGPWAEGDPPPVGATLENVTPLLLYGEQQEGNFEIDISGEHSMITFSEPDEWSGGAWLTADDKSAVIFVGTKALGESWYGFANGVVYPISGDPDEDYPDVPPWPHDSRGWWSEDIAAQILFYNPSDLAAVVTGAMEPWEPQPYATLDIDDYLLDPGYDHERQKRYLVGAVAFDRERSRLFIMERRADEDKSIVHVFQVEH
jgi:hypothetical protein